MHKMAAVVFGLGLLFSGSALGEELTPMTGRSIHLGPVSGVAYYTVEHNGFQVVATLASGESATPVRFIATLSEGQKVTISVPRGLGEAALSLEITRLGDQVAITTAQKVASLN